MDPRQATSVQQQRNPIAAPLILPPRTGIDVENVPVGKGVETVFKIKFPVSLITNALAATGAAQVTNLFRGAIPPRTAVEWYRKYGKLSGKTAFVLSLPAGIVAGAIVSSPQAGAGEEAQLARMEVGNAIGAQLAAGQLSGITREEYNRIAASGIDSAVLRGLARGFDNQVYANRVALAASIAANAVAIANNPAAFRGTFTTAEDALALAGAVLRPSIVPLPVVLAGKLLNDEPLPPKLLRQYDPPLR